MQTYASSYAETILHINAHASLLCTVFLVLALIFGFQGWQARDRFDGMLSYLEQFVQFGLSWLLLCFAFPIGMSLWSGFPLRRAPPLEFDEIFAIAVICALPFALIWLYDLYDWALKKCFGHDRLDELLLVGVRRRLPGM